jgi:hypothetical protein
MLDAGDARLDVTLRSTERALNQKGVSVVAAITSAGLPSTPPTPALVTPPLTSLGTWADNATPVGTSGGHGGPVPATPLPPCPPLLLQTPPNPRSWMPLGIVPNMGGFIPVTWIPLNVGGLHQLTLPPRALPRAHTCTSTKTARVLGGLKPITISPPATPAPTMDPHVPTPPA